ncbi:hypothetical protein M0R88_05935 [Halorussus gelatinilyticus]|uniref:Uncharacterized protein n=1 Tax=Halorussus gelatinilyticus TaxID=2937524 RepID=A0A8U0INQ3_9EURY|nr:hypothetical protein [Halorussus gelatinilyticus]UPW01639.1 hypothetical protein M0R88_05935 [Halorussus gelatinilyticus]
MTLNRIVTTVSRNITDIIVAYLLALIASGGDTFTLAKIILAIKLNVFALPLAHTPALSLPAWVYYVISVMWIAQLAHHTNHSMGDIIAELEEAYLGLRQGSDARDVDE